jgi:hypothetical protein
MCFKYISNRKEKERKKKGEAEAVEHAYAKARVSKRNNGEKRGVERL